MRPAILSACLLAIAAGGPSCRTTVSEAPAGVDQAKPIVLETQRVWRVVVGDTVAGLVVRFGAAEAPDDTTRHYYSVRNELQQELGVIDGLGRAWKFEPHQPEPRFVGSGAVLEGARAILSVGADASLVEARLETPSR